MPVESFEADSTRDPELGVEAARRLVETEGVHAIVGPTASAVSLPVAETVTGPAGVPTISPFGHLSPTDRGGRRRLLLPHCPFRHRPGTGSGSRDRGAGLRQRGLAPHRRPVRSGAGPQLPGVVGRDVAAPWQSTPIRRTTLRSCERARARALKRWWSSPSSSRRYPLSKRRWKRASTASSPLATPPRGEALVTEIGGERLGGMYGTAGTHRPGQRGHRRLGDVL